MSSKAKGSGSDWSLRYAPHLGYLPPFEPLFSQLAGGPDLVTQLDFIAAQGFSGALHPWITSHPPEAQAQFASLLRERGLVPGCVLYAGMELLMQPAWVSADPGLVDPLLEQVNTAVAIARDIGAQVVAVLVMGDPGLPRDVQAENLARNLQAAADIAAKHAVTLGIEPMIDLPGMYFETTMEAADLLRQIDHGSARLLFDTAHVAAMDGDVLAVQEQVEDLVCLYQLADVPGRIEPGAGSIDFTALLSRILASGYSGLVELEHGWAEEGAESERAGLERLRAIDTAAAKGS